jgi:hypothetical protein
MVANLEAFEHRISRGSVATNMSMSTCALVLLGRQILTAHHLAEQKAGAPAGAQFDQELKTLLGAYYDRRRAVEGIFAFDRDTRYCYLYAGGTGPNYGKGECRVFLERHLLYEFSTVFAGDTIDALFDGSGVLCIAHAKALERFATRQELRRLASIANEDVITRSKPITDAVISRLLSDRKTLIEVHVHETVRTDNIREITIADEIHRTMEVMVPRFEAADATQRQLGQFDDVRAYLTIYEQASRLGITVL